MANSAACLATSLATFFTQLGNPHWGDTTLMAWGPTLAARSLGVRSLAGRLKTGSEVA
jgi:hypothetical protein